MFFREDVVLSIGVSELCLFLFFCYNRIRGPLGPFGPQGLPFGCRMCDLILRFHVDDDLCWFVLWVTGQGLKLFKEL